MSCPQIWNIEHEKDRKLNEKKGDRDLEREIKNKGDIFFAGRITGSPSALFVGSGFRGHLVGIY